MHVKSMIFRGFMMRTPSFLRLMMLALFVVFANTTFAQTTREQANAGRIGIMTGSATGTYIKVGGDLEQILRDRSELRIVPMVGRGSLQNVEDLIYFYYTDAALVQSDVLELIRIQKPDGLEVRRLAYIARIYDEEIHVVASANSPIRTIGDLRGQRVNIGTPLSGSQVTSQLLLPFFGIDVIPSSFSNREALDKILNGELDAMIFVQKKPASILRNLDDPKAVTLVEVGLSDPMRQVYVSAEFLPEDYPGIVDGKGSPTIAVPAILAVYDNFARNSPRAINLETFAYELVDHLPDLQRNRPERWSDVDLDFEVPGWPRYQPMANALANRGPSRRTCLIPTPLCGN